MAGSTPHTVRMYLDFSSPFSYIGAARIESICERHDAELTWHWMLLGGLFKLIGGPTVPLQTFSESKRRHAVADMYRFAEAHGLPFGFPTRFPMLTVTPLRLMLAAQEDTPEQAVALAQRIFRAYWAEDRDISDKAALASFCGELGLDGAALVERTNDPAIKQRLFANTEQAAEAGVFGAPTFVVDDTELFWGQDRLLLVERMIATP